MPSPFLSRRGFIRRAGAAALGAPALGSLLGAACAPGVAPSAGGEAPRGTTGGAAWEAEWDRLVAAAKSEGSVSVVTNPGTGFRQALEKFEQAFPGITVEQQLVFRRDRSEVAREMARGTYPIAVGMNRTVLQEFMDQGLGKTLKPIPLPELSYNTAHGVWLFNRAPRPNAARVLVNWSLTKQGQEAWSTAYQYNSLRADVPFYDPENPPMKEAVWMSAEENIPVQNETREFLEALLR